VAAFSIDMHSMSIGIAVVRLLWHGVEMLGSISNRDLRVFLDYWRTVVERSCL
jgi:hypothetical protein